MFPGCGVSPPAGCDQYKSNIPCPSIPSQANLPSTIPTVMKTALHLQPFEFNQLPDPYAIRGNTSRSPAGRVQGDMPPRESGAPGNGQKRDLMGNDPTDERSTAGYGRLCAICSSPMPSRSSLHPSGIRGGDHDNSSRMGSGCCTSCLGQIVGPLRNFSREGSSSSGGALDDSAIDEFVMTLLPDIIKDRLLSSGIINPAGNTV